MIELPGGVGANRAWGVVLVTRSEEERGVRRCQSGQSCVVLIDGGYEYGVHMMFV